MKTTALMRRGEMMATLERLNSRGGKLEGRGVAVVVAGGYISGFPYLLSTSFSNAFAFKNQAQAQRFVTKYRDDLDSPEIIAR